jgi:hypothetical protein
MYLCMYVCMECKYVCNVCMYVFIHMLVFFKCLNPIYSICPHIYKCILCTCIYYNIHECI